MRFSNFFVSASLGNLALGAAFSTGRLESRKKGHGTDCSLNQTTTSAPHKNFWGSLTTQETKDVLALLHSNATGFNLTAAADAGSRDNKIISVELMMPNKTDVLPLLSDSTGTPERYALAALMFGAAESAYVQEFKVGPLPITNASYVMPYTFTNTRGDGKIPVVNPDAEDYANFNLEIMKGAEDVTKRLWNLTVEDGLQMPLAFAAPLTVTEDKVIMWQGFNAPVTSIYDTISLLPLGLYMRSDITGRDPSKWKVTGWVYNNTFYKDLDAFRKVIAEPDFKPLGANLDQPWAHTNKHGDALPLDDSPPPASVQSGKERFSVDAEESYVTWMDFAFYVSITRDNGLRLYDIRYKGKRIMYELGLDEAIAHYAGIDPVQSGTCYFDSLNGFGPTMISLVKGYDCPAYSHYVNVTQTTGETTYTQKDGLCMFEIDKGFPIQRHSWAGHTTVTKNIAFNIRAIYTIGNYDYMTTYQFHLDGSIEIDVRASGYISSAFYAENEDYGFKIHDSLSGSLHDHVITFKADFDILGEKNSLQKVAIEPTVEKYKWSEGETRSTMKAVKSFIKTEDDGKINWSPNGGAMYAVVNKDEKNPYGENPGYRIVPASGVAYLTVQNSSITGKAAHHTTHHLYVTRQKDNETYAAGAYNSLTPEDPQVDFDKYFNGESLDQEDIVVWFNLGMHHMPHTGDLPNTVFSTAHSSMLIEPMNYLLGDPSQASSQQVLIKTTDGKPEITRYGAKEATCPIDLAQLNPDLSNYSNSVSVLKYPFDSSKPDHPYRGSLHQVYRLYDDFSGSFLESILQSPEGTFQTLSAHAPGSSSLTIGVPSRLYFTRTREKPLAGVRVGVKDLYDLKGVKSSRGNRAWYNLYPAANKTATAIQNLIDAGAVIVGTQKLSQFANGENPTADWVSYLAPFNPRGDGYQGPSSSSSGAGASIASYPWLDLAVGSDTGGSIRGPAGVSGVFGNRPTHGLVSLDNVMPLSPKMDTAGFLTRDPEMWGAAQAAMYKKNYTMFSKEIVKYPRTVYTAGFPANDTPEGAILHQFANDLADFLVTNVTEYNISEKWDSTGPESVRNTPLTELLNVTYAALITKQQIALVKEPFFKDYAAAHDGRTPYVDPAPSARWAWGESQPDSILNDAIHNKTIFMDWFNHAVLPKDKDSQRCSSSILLYTQGPGIFSRRDVYLDPPSVPFGWSLSRISIFSEAPDSVYPIGEVSQFSEITGRNESLPVSVNIMVARGCDRLVPRLAEDLVGLGLLKIPKTGGSMSGGSILF
ncbi:hypothetical protein FVER53590_04368 [Fusarium verticillioides]|nr:hypothetical protein FVER53590_04368 [Fusarium verticillioides]